MYLSFLGPLPGASLRARHKPSTRVQPAMVGTTRFYQALLRDAQQPDGTGVIVSDGLRVEFSD